MSEMMVPEVVSAVQAAGRALAKRFSPGARPAQLEALRAALDENDAASLRVLRPALSKACPQAGWVEDEDHAGTLASGEWWLTDPVEGNINHVHGLPGWGLTATLVRDNVPKLTVVHLPIPALTYWASEGAGAFLNGARLTVSAKTDLRATLVSTGQAKPDEPPETRSRLGQSVTAMLQAALLVSVAVPASLQLIEVAAGRLDGFWQFAQGDAALAGGSLLVREAGGRVTDLHGREWTLESEDFLAAAPGISEAMLRVLTP